MKSNGDYNYPSNHPLETMHETLYKILNQMTVGDAEIRGAIAVTRYDQEPRIPCLELPTDGGVVESLHVVLVLVSKLEHVPY